MSEDPSERREDPRGPIELKVEYKRLNAFFADYTKNISKDGTFIKTDKPLGIGTEFVFKLFVPKLNHPLELKGQVRWILKPEDIGGRDPREPGMGIRFLYEDDAQRRRMRQLVEQLMVDSLGSLVYEKLMVESKNIPGGGEEPEPMGE